MKSLDYVFCIYLIKVVAGMRYKLVLEIGQSQSCRNKDGKASIKDCPVGKSTVRIAPWLK